MFEQATRNKLRFAYKGQCSVEDLWDLPVEELDVLYQSLRLVQKERNSESLLEKRDTTGKVLDLQVGIIKHIVVTRLAEVEEAKAEAANRLRKQKIMEIISTKQDKDLEEKSVEELTKLLEEL